MESHPKSQKVIKIHPKEKFPNETFVLPTTWINQPLRSQQKLPQGEKLKFQATKPGGSKAEIVLQNFGLHKETFGASIVFLLMCVFFFLGAIVVVVMVVVVVVGWDRISTEKEQIQEQW